MFHRTSGLDGFFGRTLPTENENLLCHTKGRTKTKCVCEQREETKSIVDVRYLAGGTKENLSSETYQGRRSASRYSKAGPLSRTPLHGNIWYLKFTEIEFLYYFLSFSILLLLSMFITLFYYFLCSLHYVLRIGHSSSLPASRDTVHNPYIC
jgi:hypothetical protein